MQEATKQFLGLLLQNDSFLTPNERQVIKSLTDGTPVALKPEIRLITGREARQRLGCGKTAFYNLRNQYQELVPHNRGRMVRYRLDWVLALIEKRSAEALNPHVKQVEANHVA